MIDWIITHPASVRKSHIRVPEIPIVRGVVGFAAVATHNWNLWCPGAFIDA